MTETEREGGVVCIQTGLTTGRVQDLNKDSANFSVWRITAQGMSLDTVLLQRSHQPLEALAFRPIVTIKPEGGDTKMFGQKLQPAVVVKVGVAEDQRVYASDFSLP